MTTPRPRREPGWSNVPARARLFSVETWAFVVGALVILPALSSAHPLASFARLAPDSATSDGGDTKTIPASSIGPSTPDETAARLRAIWARELGLGPAALYPGTSAKLQPGSGTFTNLTGAYDAFEATGVNQLASGSGSPQATNGTTLLSEGYVGDNYTNALLSYSISTGRWSVLQETPNAYWGVVALPNGDYLISVASLGNDPGTTILEEYNGATFTPLKGVLSHQSAYRWSLLGTDALGNVLTQGLKFTTSTSSPVFLLNSSNSFQSTNLTSHLPRGVEFTGIAASGSIIALGGDTVYDLPDDGVSSLPAYGVYNESSRVYTALNSSGRAIPHNNTDILTYPDSIVADAGAFYFPVSTIHENFTASGYNLTSVSSQLYAYTPRTGELVNLSKGLPKRFNIDGLFDLPDFPGVGLADYHFVLDSYTDSSGDYNSYFVYDTSSGKLVNRTSTFGGNNDYYYTSETSSTAYMVGESGTTSAMYLDTFPLHSLTIKVTMHPVPAPPSTPEFLLSNTIAGDGGYLTVGEDGFVLYANSRFESSNASEYLPGSINGAAWDGREFLLAGETYPPNPTPLLYGYDPGDGALSDLTSILPAGGKNVALESVVWNGTDFLVIASGVLPDFQTVSLLYTYNPTTGVVQNDSSLFASSQFLVNFAAELLSTPNGTFVFGTGQGPGGQISTGFGVLNGTSFTNLTAKLPANFYDVGEYDEITMAWGADRVWLAGNTYAGGTSYGIEVVTYSPASGDAVAYSTPFAPYSGSIFGATYFDGDFWLGGGIDASGLFLSPTVPGEPLLLTFAPGSGTGGTVHNLTDAVPAGDFQIDTLASNSTTMFVGGGAFLFGQGPQMGLLVPSTKGSAPPAGAPTSGGLGSPLANYISRARIR